MRCSAAIMLRILIIFLGHGTRIFSVKPYEIEVQRDFFHHCEILNVFLHQHETSYKHTGQHHKISSLLEAGSSIMNCVWPLYVRPGQRFIILLQDNDWIKFSARIHKAP